MGIATIDVVDITNSDSHGFRESAKASEAPAVRFVTAKLAGSVNVEVNDLKITAGGSVLGHGCTVELDGVKVPKVRAVRLVGEAGKPWRVEIEAFVV